MTDTIKHKRKMIAMLQRGEYTLEEMADSIGIDYETASEILESVRIEGYLRPVGGHGRGQKWHMGATR